MKVGVVVRSTSAVADISSPITEAALDQIARYWIPAVAGQEDGVWDWREIVATCPHGGGWQQFVLTFEDRVQGAAILREKYPMRSPENTERVGCYLEYLAIAPWNRVDGDRNRVDTRFDRVTPIGRLLLCQAVKASVKLGHEGRIGWLSKVGAISWYKKMMPELWEGGVDAVENLPYYEASAACARKFLDAAD